MSERYTIDRFLNVKSATNPTWSPDGSRIAFLTNITGTMQVWSVDRAGGWPHQLTFFPDRVMSVEYAPNAERLLLHMDAGGNERAQLWELAGDGSEIRPLCHCATAIQTGTWSPDGTQVYFGSNRRHGAYFDLYRAAAGSDQPELLLEHDGSNYVQSVSPDGRFLLFTRREVSLHNGLHLLDLQSREVRPLTASDTEAAYHRATWAKDGRSLYLTTDKERNFFGLARMDLETGALTWLHTPEWDVEALALSPDGKRLAFTVNAGGKSDLFFYETETGKIEQVAAPQGVIGQLEWSPSGDALAFVLDGPTRPMNIWLWEQGRVRQLTFAPQGGIPSAVFAEPTLVSYPTFDGLDVPAWLYLPAGARQGDGLPVIVQVHGGPEGQTRASFNNVIQYFVHRGYAVLAPNVRGSTGYGKVYTHLDDVRKRMDSVADLAACVPFLAQTGYVDPKKITVMGGSYGGFMVLAALTHYPDLWAAGVDTVGIANFESFLENTGAYRRKLRESEYGSLEHDREFFREISPIWHVDKISAALFVIHGANDPRVPIGEAEQIVAAVKAKGGVVEYLRFEDEGHGVTRLPNRLQTYPAVADFLDRNVVSKA